MGGSSVRRSVAASSFQALRPLLVNPGDQVDTVDLRCMSMTVLFDRPVADWRLDEDGGSVAVSGGQHTANRFGGFGVRFSPALSRTAGGGQVVRTSPGMLRVPNKPALQLAGDRRSSSGSTSRSATRQTLVSKDFLREFELTLETNGTAEFSYQGNGIADRQRAVGEGTVTPNIWQHVVVTRSRGHQRDSVLCQRAGEGKRELHDRSGGRDMQSVDRAKCGGRTVCEWPSG